MKTAGARPRAALPYSFCTHLDQTEQVVHVVVCVCARALRVPAVGAQQQEATRSERRNETVNGDAALLLPLLTPASPVEPGLKPALPSHTHTHTQRLQSQPTLAHSQPTQERVSENQPQIEMSAKNADDLVAKADKKLASFGLFGNKYEDAAELLEKAAVQYKLAKACEFCVERGREREGRPMGFARARAAVNTRPAQSCCCSPCAPL